MLPRPRCRTASRRPELGADGPLTTSRLDTVGRRSSRRRHLQRRGLCEKRDFVVASRRDSPAIHALVVVANNVGDFFVALDAARMRSPITGCAPSGRARPCQRTPFSRSPGGSPILPMSWTSPARCASCWSRRESEPLRDVSRVVATAAEWPAVYRSRASSVRPAPPQTKGLLAPCSPWHRELPRAAAAPDTAGRASEPRRLGTRRARRSRARRRDMHRREAPSPGRRAASR